MTVSMREFIEEALATEQEALHSATHDLTLEQLRWRPEGHDNSIGFLMWHVARVDDNFIQRLILKGDEVWASGGWQEKFGNPTRGIGAGFTPAQVAEAPIPSFELLWGYRQAVRAKTLEYLANLDWDTLTETPRPNLPQWTIQTVLRQIIAHSNQHLGEMNYQRGLQGLPGALG